MTAPAKDALKWHKASVGDLDQLHPKERECYDTICKALQTLSGIEDGKLFLCERKAHLPEYDGATGYFYYALAEGK